MPQNYKKSCIYARGGWHNLSFLQKNSIEFVFDGVFYIVIVYS